MLMLSNVNAMILMTDFEKAGGGEQDQKRFLELPWAKAWQLKNWIMFASSQKFNDQTCFYIPD